MKIEIYCDGSGLIKQKEKYYESSSAVSIYIDDEPIYKARAFHPGGTGNLGEVYGLFLGLYKMRDILKMKNIDPSSIDISVYSDSEYVIFTVNKYIKNWVRAGLDATWISYSTKKPVIYQNYWKSIYRDFLYKKNPYNIKFYHINSHIMKSNLNYKRSAWFNFMKSNLTEITIEEFTIHSDRNDEVDKLATEARDNKHSFEEKWGQKKWEIKPVTINGKIRIRNPRKN